MASNLISNAVSHGAPGTPIVVQARQEAEQFVLAVTNHGPPIPTDARERLFQPFARGSTEGRQQGLGLGLFIVSEIAKAHGGTINVVSTDGGTTFTFSMPTARKAG